MTAIHSLLRAGFLCGLFGSFLLVLEFLVRRQSIHPDISRRIAHIASGLFALLMYKLFTPAVFLTCNFILLIVMAISYWKNILSSIHRVERKTYGELFLPLGILITFVMSQHRPDLFIPAILIVTFADACAGIIGDLRQKNRASRVGSVVFFVVSFSLLKFFLPDMPTAISLAFILTVVEQVSPLGSDNLTIPLTATILLSTLT